MRASNILIVAGAALLLIGLTLRLFPGAFSWFGHLPGDIRYQSGDTQVLIPITSMLLVSVALTLVINLVARIFRGE